MTTVTPESDLSTLAAQLDRLNKNIERDIAARMSWKLALRNGLFAAVGGVLGTTIVLSIVVKFLQPLTQVAALKPTLERLANQQKSR